MELTKSVRFKSLQKEKALSVSESANISTAELIGFYLSQVAFLQIKTDIKGAHNTSMSYQQVQKKPNFNKALLLYAVLDIEEGIDLLSKPNEKQALKELNDDLMALYLNFYNKPIQRINNLLVNFAKFLAIMNKDVSNKRKVKELYYTSYFILCFAQ